MLGSCVICLHQRIASLDVIVRKARLPELARPCGVDAVRRGGLIARLILLGFFVELLAGMRWL